MRAPVRTLTETRPEPIADLDTDRLPACFRCGRPATWSGRYRTCRHQHLWCAACRTEAIALIRKARQMATDHIHHCCGVANPDGITWTEL